MLLLKVILWYFDNYITHCQEENDFSLLHLFIFVVYLKEQLFSFVYLQKFRATIHTLICSNFEQRKNGSK